MLEKIVSGGQTGVDRAALDAALADGLPCGGWCPRGRKAEDGVLDPRYPLQETPSAEYAQRTEWNVRDSDGTLVLLWGEAQGGTALTAQFAAQYGKPLLVLNPTEHGQVHTVWQWIAGQDIQVLNIAGPRESEQPGIYKQASAFLQQLFRPGCWGWTE